MAGSRKAPFVAVRTDIRKEERVLVIADIAGYNRHEAMGRLLDLWAWCTDRWLQDAPEDCEGYAVNEAVVCRFLGPCGVRAILGDGCDELALGQLRPDGLVYLRGTSETVSRLRALRRSSSAGGEARVGGATPTRKRGRFVGKPTKAPAASDMVTSQTPAAPDLLTSQPPARTSVYPQTTNHKPDPEEELSLAPPAPRPEVRSDHKRVVDDFSQRYRDRYGSKPTWGGKQGKIVSTLLTQHSADEVIRRSGILFSSPPAFLEGSAFDIGTLAQHFDKLVEPQQRRMAFGASRVRDPTIGRVEPSRPDQYPDGDQPI